jgi:glucokinase
MVDDLVTHAKQLLPDETDIAACGVAIGGPLDAPAGIVKGPPNLSGWDNVPLKSILEHALGIPTRVEHDATACALAETRWGIGADASRLAYFTCGTGFGVGFVFDGDPYYGAAGYPPDIGHVRLWDEGPMGYGEVGTIEGRCAASALGRIAAWKFPDRWADPPTPEDIASLAQAGDADALTVIDINASAVGRSCALVGDLLHSDMIVLGSLAQYLGGAWVDRVRESYESFSHPAARASCRIVRSNLGSAVQDLGAIVAGIRLLEGAS